MTWLMYCFISITFTIIYSLISKKLLNKKENYHPITYASALFVSVAIYSILFYIITGINTTDFIHLLKPHILLTLLLNLFCYTLAPTLYYYSLKNLPLSTVTILYALTGIYTFIISIIIKTEIFHMDHLLGAVLIVISTILITIKDSKWRSNKYLRMMILATFLYAIAAITDNQVIANGYFTPLFFQSLSFGIPAILILGINSKARKQISNIYNMKVFPLIFLNGLFFFISFFAIYMAYKSGGQASGVNIVLSVETVITVTLAVIFLKERKDLLVKLISALCATLGVYFLR